MPYKRKETVSASGDSLRKKFRHQQQDIASRRDPSSRGIHVDGIKVELSKSNRAKCVTCKRKIDKDELRWGVKYSGNPISGEPVLPLYGTHPMYMWNHATCGFAFGRYSELEKRNKTWLATRTCHLCEDSPRQGESDLRLRCGGPETGKGEKVLYHHFHPKCVKKALEKSGMNKLEIHASSISGWEDLSEEEKNYAKDVFP